jgi:hypothetical protein
MKLIDFAQGHGAELLPPVSEEIFRDQTPPST